MVCAEVDWIVDMDICRTYCRPMLKREMQDAVANCPDLFMELGLTLVRRQVVINGRRPDALFSDAFSRHLLVET